MPTAETVVIGAINHHEWPVVAPWIKSLRKTSFTGRVILVTYEDVAEDVKARMRHHGVEIIEARMEISVNRGRFKDFAAILASFSPETCVVATDVRDVVFQENPSVLASLLDVSKNKELVVSSEGWRYHDSEWNLATLRKVFPDHEARMLYEEVYCSGVIVGTAGALKQLSERIWDISKTAPSFNGDQVAMNIALREPEFFGQTRFLTVQDGRIFHARATWLRHKMGQSTLGEPTFSMLRGIALKVDEKPVSILHQYTESTAERTRVLLRYGSLWLGLWYRIMQRFRPAQNDNVYWKTKPAAHSPT
ncbi:hypothetical protein [Prosthecobacter sp.]|uniref:hypothetical protein n=1 Tax=Prosthecobacter sp. TaxID=1965333 RepID=UPI003783DB9E